MYKMTPHQSYMPPSIAEMANRHMQCLDEMQSKIDSMIMNLGTFIPEPLVNSVVYKESDDDIEVTLDKNTLLMGDEDISTTPARETDKFIKSSVDDLVPILMESEVTSDSNSECDMPTPLPTTDNEDVAGLPRHLVKRLFSHLVKNPSFTKRISDEPLGDDSKSRSYDVTFSNSLFEFNDDFTLCNDNPLFDEEFEDISSLDPPKSAPLNYEPLGNPDLVSRSLEAINLNLEELSAKIDLDDSILTKIDDGYYDSERDILFLEHLLIKETFSDPTLAVLSKKSTLLVTPTCDIRDLTSCSDRNWKMRFEHSRTSCFRLGEFILALGLHTEEEMAEARFGAYLQGSERVIPNKGDLRDYWIEISFDRDFLGAAPSYVFIRDPVRRLCHMMISCSISGRGQVPEKVTGIDLFYLRSMDQGTANVSYLLAQYLFRHAKGRKSRARLSGGHFIGRLAAHFGLVNDQGLRGLSMVSRELSLIDLHELERHNTSAEDAPAADEGAQAVLAPVQAPQPPPPTPQHWTMSQRIEEEMRELQQSIVGLRGVVESSITEQTRVSTGMISCMTQLMDASGRTYQAFDRTLVGSSLVSYQRRVRPRTGDASTSTAPHTDDQPDP
ncbi:hypothetical protein Tco_0713519 [Tanacetum coccineum]